ncbi:hypothetical protein HBI31_137370 [Parastagonospora nodorum]|nr:hypothetical protein HBI31_137370 [Parastagonospora nodorum]
MGTTVLHTIALAPPTGRKIHIRRIWVLPYGHQSYVPPPPQPSGGFYGYSPAPFRQSSGGYNYSDESIDSNGVVSTHIGSSGQHAPPSNTNEQHLQPGGLAPASDERVMKDGQVPSVSAVIWQDKLIRLYGGSAMDAPERRNGQ